MHTISVLITLDIPGASSLKDKRAVVRSLVERLRQRLRVAAAETGAQDRAQSGEIGFAVVSGDRAEALHQVDEALHFIESELLGRAEVLRVVREENEIEGTR